MDSSFTPIEQMLKFRASRHVRRVLLLARVYVRTGNGLWRIRLAAVYSGLCRSMFPFPLFQKFSTRKMCQISSGI